MSLTNQFKLDEIKIIQGVEIQLGENDDGTVPTFLISTTARLNKSYAKELERTFKPHQNAMRLKTMSNDLAGKLMQEVFSKTVLLGWQNVLNSDVSGDDTQTGFADFNLENAKNLFENLPMLYDSLSEQAADTSNFRQAVIEENAKN